VFGKKDKSKKIKIPETPAVFDTYFLGQDMVISTGDEGHASSTMAAVCLHL
jgi:hypothetical protein